MATPIWDPTSTFGIINPDPAYECQTCIGYAPSCRRRCRNPINMDNRATAKKILRSLSMMEPSVHTMRGILGHLATICLCVRYHRDQAAQVVATWCRAIEREQQRMTTWGPSTTVLEPVRPVTAVPRRLLPAAPYVPVSGNSSSTSSSSSRASSPSSVSSFGSMFDGLRPYSPSSSSSRGSSSSSRTTLLTSSSTRSSRTAPPRPTPSASSDSGSSSSTASGRVVRTTRPSTLSSASTRSTGAMGAAANRTPSLSTSSTVSTQSSETIDPSRMATPPATSRVVTPSSASTSVTSTNQRCTERHIRRRSADTECPICMNLMTTTQRSELVWCKSQCGQNFHKWCWELWEDQSHHRRTFCACCRASWPSACEHDSSTPPDFSIWTEDDLGLRALFDLRAHVTAILDAWL